MKTRVVLAVGAAATVGLVLLMACYALQTKTAVAALAAGGPASRSKLVRSNAELIPAILAARPGDRVLLAAGAYERLGLQGVKVAGEVTIASADPGNRALVAGIELSDCRGLRFENMDLTVNARNLIAFNISNSDHIALEGLNIQDPAVKYSGVLIRDSSDVSVTGSEIHHIGASLRIVDSNRVTVATNRFHDIGGDGIQAVGSSYVTISGNHFTDFYPSPGDHPDAIQFFTVNTKAPAHDLTITDNVIVRGQGGITQGIFLGNEIAMPYQKVTITGNTLIGTMYNGIAVGEGEHVLIANNVVQAYADMGSWIVIDRNVDVTVTNNQAADFIYKRENKRLNEKGNKRLKAVRVGDLSALQARRAE